MRTTEQAPNMIESAACSLLPALGAIGAATIGASRDAERHALRLRFALARVAELRARASAIGGVFEPARLEVAQSILETHHKRAASFAKAIGVADQRPAERPASRLVPGAVNESAIEERAA